MRQFPFDSNFLLMKKIPTLFLFIFLTACGGGGSETVEEKATEAATEAATDAATEAATNAANQLAADAFAKAEAEKLKRFGTGKFGQSTFQ